MALLFMDGFDLRNGVSTRGWATGGFGQGYTYTAGDLGGSAMRVSISEFGGSGNAVLRRTLPSTYSQVVWGFRFTTSASRGSGLTANNIIYLGDSSYNVIGAIRLSNTTGRITVVNSGGTTIATGFRNVLNTGWHYLEIRLKINGASGEVEVYVDGTIEISTTVGNFGSTNIGSITYWIYDEGLSDIHVDDIYVLDTTGGAPLNTFLGDCRIETLTPTSDGANADWTPNSGVTEYTQIDEGAAGAYDSDTTYIWNGTPGDTSTFGHSDLSFASGTVYAVQTSMIARKDDAGTRQIRPVIRQGGVDYLVGDIQTLSTTYAISTSLFPLDPVAATWTVANVNANEYGVELTA